MFRKLLCRKLLSPPAACLIAKTVVFASQILLTGYAFIKMATLHLNTKESLLGLAIVISLSLLCMILVALIDLTSGTRCQSIPAAATPSAR